MLPREKQGLCDISIEILTHDVINQSQQFNIISGHVHINKMSNLDIEL